LRGSRIAAPVTSACIKKPHTVRHRHITLGLGAAVQQTRHKHRTCVHTCSAAPEVQTPPPVQASEGSHTALQRATTRNCHIPPPYSTSPAAVTIHTAISAVQQPLQQLDKSYSATIKLAHAAPSTLGTTHTSYISRRPHSLDKPLSACPRRSARPSWVRCGVRRGRWS
jgi:hypothetical protein